MQLILLRHGKAEAHGHPGGDGARALVGKGREQAAMAAGILARAGFLPEIVISRPVLRARETAEIFCHEASMPGPLMLPWLACGMHPETALAELAGFREFKRVAIVGHEPDFSGLIEWLLGISGGAVEMKKGGVACIEIQPPSRGGQLLFLAPPKLLRASAH
jgi:phosphohistidine phosphatase